MVYAVWLFSISIAFVIAERLWPWRKQQKLFREGLLSDVLYIVFNSEYLGIVIAVLTAKLLAIYNPDPLVTLNLMKGKPYWLQFLILLPAFDLAQWAVHNALHRVPILWRFHKVHHSVVDMDWIGNWRFHWGEIFVYRVAMYVPTAVLGFAPAVLFYYGILNTIIGHYAHANMRLSLGPLKYVLNTPQMHIWHHNHPDCGPINKNFAITLSVWDWVFGTAYMPEKPPERLGFEGIETYPKNIAGQWVQPFVKG
ncbi:MAG: sterol desaturase family protein [Acidobacteria bacterium]|nr:sterol desaturase family protein [Acidobacteriota bacterium]